jgi:hypothetical protein
LGAGSLALATDWAVVSVLWAIAGMVAKRVQQPFLSRRSKIQYARSVSRFSVVLTAVFWRCQGLVWFSVLLRALSDSLSNIHPTVLW